MSRERWRLLPLSAGNMLSEWRRWSLLAWFDIVGRYRRTMLGPFWIVLTTAVTVIAIGTVYGAIFAKPLHEFLPFIAIGIVVWNWINATVTEACSAFVTYKYILLNQIVSPSSLIVRTIVRNFFVFMHNAIVIVIVLLIYRSINWQTIFLIIPAIGLTLATLYCIGIILAYGCSRFRDLQQVTISLTGVLFLVTPILWPREILGARAYLADFNPVTHFLQILRLPLIAQHPTQTNWFVCIALFAFCAFIANFVTLTQESRLRFWL